MNTSVTAVLYTSKTLRNGEHPLMLRLTKNRKLKYISLHISLDAKYWDADKGKPKRNCPDRDKIIRLIELKTKRKYISLHLSLNPKYWDFAKNQPKRNCPNRDKILHLMCGIFPLYRFLFNYSFS